MRSHSARHLGRTGRHHQGAPGPRRAPCRERRHTRLGTGAVAWAALLAGAFALGPLPGRCADPPQPETGTFLGAGTAASQDAPSAQAASQSAVLSGAASPSLDPLGSLDAYLRGLQALRSRDFGAAARHWTAASEKDPEALPAHLALAGTRLWQRPTLTVEAWRRGMTLLVVDFRGQRWVVRHALLGLALGGTLAVLLLAGGLIARHLRAMVHLIYETLAWSLRPGLPAHLLTWVLLALPVLANVGPLGSALFWVFLFAFRFSRPERFLALTVAAWILIVGPALSLCGPLWSQAPDGRDAGLLYEVQRDPTSTSESEAVRTWLESEPDAALPNYLEGVRRLTAGDGPGADSYLARAGATGEMPLDVLEGNLGCSALLRQAPEQALGHFMQAAKFNPASFTVHYDKGLALARQGRFAEADAALDQAGRLDLDRLRGLGRMEARNGPGSPLPVLWSRVDLWDWSFRHPGAAVPPALLSAFFPLRSLTGSWVVLAAAIVAGLLAGKWLGRLLSVRICYQCGAPICRRCLVRLGRHAYCQGCAEELGGVGLGETTRLLLQRLLEDHPRSLGLLGRRAAYIAPGIGACARGGVRLGTGAAVFAGFGAALLLFPFWGRPVLPMMEDPQLLQWIRFLGCGLLFFSLVLNAAGIQGADRRGSSMRAFLSRDVDRMAA